MKKAQIINMDHLNKNNNSIEFDLDNTAIGIAKVKSIYNLYKI